MVVVRPTGVYSPIIANSLVWLGDQFRSRSSAGPIKSLANKSGRCWTAIQAPALTKIAWRCEMAKALYSKTQIKHTAGINYLRDLVPGIETQGFWAALRQLGEEEDLDFTEQPFRPDAYRIDRAAKVVEIHEVVETHEPSVRVLRMMGLLYMDFDAEDEWCLKMYVHRRGYPPVQADLFYWYLDCLAGHTGHEAEWLGGHYLSRADLRKSFLLSVIDAPDSSPPASPTPHSWGEWQW